MTRPASFAGERPRGWVMRRPRGELAFVSVVGTVLGGGTFVMSALGLGLLAVRGASSVLAVISAILAVGVVVGLVLFVRKIILPEWVRWVRDADPGGLVIRIDEQGIRLGALTRLRRVSIPWHHIEEIILTGHKSEGRELELEGESWDPVMFVRLRTDLGESAAIPEVGPYGRGFARTMVRTDDAPDPYDVLVAAVRQYAPERPRISDRRELL